MTRYIFAFLLAALIAAPALAQDDPGMAAYQAGEYEAAIDIWSELAEQNSIIAQYNLGGMYQRGLGAAQDSRAAYRYFLAAAERGHAGSQYNIGVMYTNGTGVERDYVQAYLWTSLALDNLVTPEEHDRALSVRDVIATRMTPEELARTQTIDPRSLLLEEPAPVAAQTAAAAPSEAAPTPAPAPEEETAAPVVQAPPAQQVAGDVEEPAPAQQVAEDVEDPAPAQQVAEDVEDPAPVESPDLTEVAATVDDGTDGYRIQLASYLTHGMAEEGWRRLSQSHDTLLSLYDPVIEAVDLDDQRTIYRLKIGDFGSRDEAADLCADLQTSGADCLVTKIR